MGLLLRRSDGRPCGGGGGLRVALDEQEVGVDGGAHRVWVILLPRHSRCLVLLLDRWGG